MSEILFILKKFWSSYVKTSYGSGLLNTKHQNVLFGTKCRTSLWADVGHVTPLLMMMMMTMRRKNGMNEKQMTAMTAGTCMQPPPPEPRLINTAASRHCHTDARAWNRTDAASMHLTCKLNDLCDEQQDIYLSVVIVYFAVWSAIRE